MPDKSAKIFILHYDETHENSVTHKKTEKVIPTRMDQ